MSYVYKRNQMPSLTYTSLKTVMRHRQTVQLTSTLYAHKDYDDSFVLKQQGNIIATYTPDGTIVLSNCGWYSATTKGFLNDLVPFGHLYQHKHDWYWAPSHEKEDKPIEWLGSAKFENGQVYFKTADNESEWELVHG